MQTNTQAQHNYANKYTGTTQLCKQIHRYNTIMQTNTQAQHNYANKYTGTTQLCKHKQTVRVLTQHPNKIFTSLNKILIQNNNENNNT
jgi:hypothetical protein